MTSGLLSGLIALVFNGLAILGLIIFVCGIVAVINEKFDLGFSDEQVARYSEKIEIYVRKLAHVIEFFALGLFVCGFAICLGDELSKRLISMPLLIVLSIAVADEWIQSFADRGSLVTDVVLDFTGALAGLLTAAVLYWILRKISAVKK